MSVYFSLFLHELSLHSVTVYVRRVSPPKLLGAVHTKAIVLSDPTVALKSVGVPGVVLGGFGAGAGGGFGAGAGGSGFGVGSTGVGFGVGGSGFGVGVGLGAGAGA
jgi:hypothetical protein